MSRIHEALRKAELDRSSQVVDATVALDPRVAAPASEHQAAPSNATDGLMERHVGTVTSDGPLPIEDLQARCARPQWRPDPNLNVFSNPLLSVNAAEQFRTLRSRLYQLRNNQPLQTLLVTSAAQGDGKTSVTTNLAHAIVRQPDRRVLMIDGDLRASRLHVPLGAPRTPGLSDYLRGDIDEIAAIQHGQEGGLFFIPSGNPVTNPSELLANGRLRVLLDRVAAAFDWVIFDSPPCVPVADASVIADVCDGVLLVVRAGQTAWPSAQKASQELRGKNVVGVVLNTVEKDAFGYGSYYGSGYGANDRPANSNKLNMMQ